MSRLQFQKIAHLSVQAPGSAPLLAGQAYWILHRSDIGSWYRGIRTFECLYQRIGYMEARTYELLAAWSGGRLCRIPPPALRSASGITLRYKSHILIFLKLKGMLREMYCGLLESG
jgi:hypothetical protein